MPRVAGVDIPADKRTDIALTYIMGIGRTTAAKVCQELNLDPAAKSKSLSDEQLSLLSSHLDQNYTIEGSLRRLTSQNIQRLKEINCYRGLRHKRGLPVRGQRTKTNARTRAATAAFSRASVPSTLVSRNFCLPCVAMCGLCSVAVW